MQHKKEGAVVQAVIVVMKGAALVQALALVLIPGAAAESRNLAEGALWALGWLSALAAAGTLGFIACAMQDMLNKKRTHKRVRGEENG